MEENHIGSGARGGGGMGIDVTTLAEGVAASSFAAAGDRLPWSLSYCLSSCSCGGARTSGVRHNVPEKKEAETLEFEAWPDLRNFRIWRMNFRSEISSCASRPMEAMVCINEIESVESIADL